MATNIVKENDDIITAVAGGTIASGSVQEINGFCGIALTDAVSGDSYALRISGVATIGKKTGETWAQFDKLYWDSSAVTASKTYVSGSADQYIGLVATANAVSGSTSGDVVLNASIDAETGDVVLKSLYDANSVLYATTDNTPVALTVGASTFVGRKSTGDIVALSTTEARTELNVEDGADVTDATNVAAAGAVMDTDLAYWQVTVSSGATSTTVALATAGFVTGKPVFGAIINNTSNLVAFAKTYDDGTTLSVHVTADPGVSNASVALWQDKR